MNDEWSEVSVKNVSAEWTVQAWITDDNEWYKRHRIPVMVRSAPYVIEWNELDLQVAPTLKYTVLDLVFSYLFCNTYSILLASYITLKYVQDLLDRRP